MDDELEQRVAEMSDADFDRLVARTRPPRIDAADKLRTAEASGDWKTAFRIKTGMLNNLMNPKKD